MLRLLPYHLKEEPLFGLNKGPNQHMFQIAIEFELHSLLKKTAVFDSNVIRIHTLITLIHLFCSQL